MRIVFYLLMFGAIVAFGFVLAADAPQQKLSRFGPGGSKFISPHEPAREVWRMPTWTEAIVYIQYYAGGFDDIPDARQKGPAAIHQEMVDNKIDAFSKAFQAMTIACACWPRPSLPAPTTAKWRACCPTFSACRSPTR